MTSNDREPLFYSDAGVPFYLPVGAEPDDDSDGPSIYARQLEQIKDTPGVTPNQVEEYTRLAHDLEQDEIRRVRAWNDAEMQDLHTLNDTGYEVGCTLVEEAKAAIAKAERHQSSAKDLAAEIDRLRAERQRLVRQHADITNRMGVIEDRDKFPLLFMESLYLRFPAMKERRPSLFNGAGDVGPFGRRTF
jgi:hypothetical protein